MILKPRTIIRSKSMNLNLCHKIILMIFWSKEEDRACADWRNMVFVIDRIINMIDFTAHFLQCFSHCLNILSFLHFCLSLTHWRGGRGTTVQQTTHCTYVEKQVIMGKRRKMSWINRNTGELWPIMKPGEGNDKRGLATMATLHVFYIEAHCAKRSLLSEKIQYQQFFWLTFPERFPCPQLCSLVRCSCPSAHDQLRGGRPCLLRSPQCPGACWEWVARYWSHIYRWTGNQRLQVKR